MDVNELLGWLTDGLDDTEKAVVTKSVLRDSVKTKAAGLKAETEFNRVMSERLALQQELEGDGTANKSGARAYQQWYEKNSAAILANDKKIQDFDAKWGTGAFAKTAAGELPAAQPTATTATIEDLQKLVDARFAAAPQVGKMTDEEIQRIVDKRFQEQYAPSTANTVVTAGHLLQKHMFAGRKTPIDFNALAKLANEKHGGNMDNAYDEWDKPERDRLAAASTEAEIQRRVDEEIQKRGAVTNFPAGADASPGSLFAKPAKDFDRNQLLMDMAKDLSGATQ